MSTRRPTSVPNLSFYVNLVARAEAVMLQRDVWMRAQHWREADYTVEIDHLGLWKDSGVRN